MEQRLIRLSTGQLVDVLQLKPEQILVWDFAWAMGMITRNGGHLPVQWSVLDHSVLVYILAMMENKGNVNPLDKLACLLHDASEAYTGDMLGPVRTRPPFDGVHALTEHITAIILARWGLDRAAINWTFLDRYDKQAFYVESMWFTPDLKGGPGMPKEVYPMEKLPHLSKVTAADYVTQLRELSVQLAGVNNGRPAQINDLFAIPDHLRKYAFPPDTPERLPKAEGIPTRSTENGDNLKSDESVLNMRLT